MVSLAGLHHSLRGAWRDCDPNDIFAYYSLIYYFLDFKFSNFVCSSELHPLVWSFFKNSFRKKKNIRKTTQNASAPSIFIVLPIVLKLGAPLLHTQAQNTLLGLGVFFRCFSLSARIDFRHLGEKQTHIHCNGTSSTLNFFLRKIKAWNASMAVDSIHWNRKGRSWARALNDKNRCVWLQFFFHRSARENVTSRSTVGAMCAHLFLSLIFRVDVGDSLYKNCVFSGTLCFFYRPPALIWRKTSRNVVLPDPVGFDEA